MKKLIFPFLLFCGLASLHAQKEAYFTDEVKHTVSMQGIELNNELNYGLYLSPTQKYQINSSLQYFYEKALGKNFSIKLSGGLLLQNGRVLKYFYDDNGMWSNGEYHFEQSYNVSVQVEPRYYFYLAQKKSENTAGLNSGWFVGLPVGLWYQMSPSTYKSYNFMTRNYDNEKYSLIERLPFHGGINLGYRYAFTNKWIVEGAFGTIVGSQGGFVNAHIKWAYIF